MSNTELFESVKSILDDFNVQSRKMFGGIGIFSEKIMFSMIYDGVLYFRSTKDIASGYSVDSIQFQHPSRNSKMPYWSVPHQIIKNKSMLANWADNAFQLAKSLKRN
jgi:DNA transformation protein